jgi:hypothetical protein
MKPVRASSARHNPQPQQGGLTYEGAPVNLLCQGLPATREGRRANAARSDLRNASVTAGTRQYLMHPDQAPAGEPARFKALNQRAKAAAARTPSMGPAGSVKPSGGVLFNRDALGLPQNETSVAVCRQTPGYVLGGTNDYGESSIRAATSPAGTCRSTAGFCPQRWAAPADRPSRWCASVRWRPGQSLRLWVLGLRGRPELRLLPGQRPDRRSAERHRGVPERRADVGDLPPRYQPGRSGASGVLADKAPARRGRAGTLPRQGVDGGRPILTLRRRDRTACSRAPGEVRGRHAAPPVQRG